MPFTAPGDLVTLDEEGRIAELLEASPLRATPPCQHFGTCGGCALQHLNEETYRAFKRDQVVQTLAQRGITDVEVLEPVIVPPHSRRRAALKAIKQNGETKLGFNARASHALVDMHECPVLTPDLFALTGKLRPMLHAILREGEKCDLHLTEADNGFDLSLGLKRATAPAVVSQIAQRAPQMGIARVTAGRDPLAEFETPHLRIGPADVRLPPDPFLQATRASEQFLQDTVVGAIGKARNVADLFCGLGTFALPLAKTSKVHAFDGDAAMIAALTAAARATSGLKPLKAERRDLFRRPLAAFELNSFDAVVIDPPRAGAPAQIEQIAESKLSRLIYVSCSPATFARDARTLIDKGFRLGPVTPLDQFLWSAQLELVAIFEK